MNKLLNFREEQKAIFESDPDIKLGDVTTVNLTTMSGGIQVSCSSFQCYFRLGYVGKAMSGSNIQCSQALGILILGQYCTNVSSDLRSIH